MTDVHKQIEVLRQRHAFENEQIHKRLTWLGQFESILFAALGLAWNGRAPNWLAEVIAWLGLAISLQAIVALGGVTLSLIHLQNAWFERNLQKHDEFGLFGLYAGKKVHPLLVIPGPELSIPFLCATAWGFILYLKYFYSS